MYILLILICIALYAFVHYYILLPHKFWIKKGIKQGKPTFLFGDITYHKKEAVGFMVDRLYKMFSNDRYSGIYMFLKPFLLIRDPKLIKEIAIKDFDSFTDHQFGFQEDIEPIWSQNLFGLKGAKWKEMRATLSPVFTSRKMKAMFVLMSDCAERFTNYFVQHPEERKLDLYDAFTRYTTDAIATSAFGIEVNSMENKTNEFYMMGKILTKQQTILQTSKVFMAMAYPRLCKFFGMRIFDPCVADFFQNIVSETIEYREKNGVVRPDLMQLFMEARKGQLLYDENTVNETETGFATVAESQYGKLSRKPKELSVKEMTSQALVFFFGGFDSISTLMCFVSHELGADPDMQQRLYNEIVETNAKCNGKITYEALNGMKYMDMIICETLRMWSPAPFADRVCVRDYTIEPENDNETPLHITKKDALWIPIWGIHHDEKYYPNPDKFDPERFSDANKANIQPYTYMPFGLGPRNCIASRFVLLETKVLIHHLLTKFEIVVNEKTQIPIKLINRGFSISNEKGFNFTLKPRN